MTIIKDTDLLAQIDELRADVQALRDRLSTGVGVPAYQAATAGDVLKIVSSYPTWGAPALVSVSVTAPITSTGGATPTIGHATSGVSAASYTYASITVNASGHVTAASNGTAPVTAINVTSPIASTGGLTPTLSHATSGVTAGSYTNLNCTINAEGHITAASNGTGGSAAWGSITGTLSSQTDLWSVIYGKANLSGGNSFSGTQYCDNQFYSTGATAGFAMEDRSTSTVWAMYSTGNNFYFWNSVFGNTFTVSEAGTLTIANVTLSGTLTLPGTTSQYVRGDGSRATFPTIPSGTVTSVSAGNGMSFSTITGSGAVTLGTPSTLTASTSNSASGTTHTHAITGFMPTTGGTFSGAITAPGVTDSSDIRFKSDIRELRDGLRVVLDLIPSRFHNTLTGNEEVGLIAQDVRDVLPEVVTTDDNGDLAVAYQRIVAPLISAVQSLDARLRMLEAR